jgi:hypothetical protein
MKAREVQRPRWFKSSSSSVTGCVEVAFLPGRRVGVRDSVNPAVPPHVVSSRAWADFLAGIKKGNFDMPVTGR